MENGKREISKKTEWGASSAKTEVEERLFHTDAVNQATAPINRFLNRATSPKKKSAGMQFRCQRLLKARAVVLLPLPCY